MTRRAAPSCTLACLIALAAGGQAFAHGPDHDPAPTPAPKPAPAPAPTQFDNGVPVPVAGREPDSDAPPGAAPHWLPHDMWIHLHWVPFDEARLQKLLRASRAELWNWLRHDVQTLAELGAQRGYPSARKLAAALVAPRAGDVSVAKLRVLRARTLRVLVQGHLSQHLIFHSLHQEAGPEAAAKLFGVRDTQAFALLRRLDLSPLRIGRTHGRTRAGMQGGLARELRAAARRRRGRRDVPAPGANRAAAPAAPGSALARRGPLQRPAAETEGKLRFPFRPSFASPALSGDGRSVMFDAQQPAPPLAVRYGEVVLEGRDLQTGAQLDPRDASRAALEDRPCSSYRPDLSDDGSRIAFEMSAGNRTYAKRYGNVVIALADLATRSVRVVAGSTSRRRVETAYNPALSGDGNIIAYQSVVADPMSDSARWATRVRVHDVRAGTSVNVSPGNAYDPAVSGDGRRVAYSAFTRASGGKRRMQVFVFDRSTHRTVLVSVLGAGSRLAAEAWEPALSGDARRIAFAATTRTSGNVRVASLGSGGRALAGWSGQPDISGDGMRVAFTTDAGVPAGGGPGGLRVMVRNLAAATTTIANPPAPLGSFDTGAGALQPGPARLCSLAAPVW